MPNDAKLGLVVGIGMVLLLAVIFFRKEPATAQTAPAPQPAPAVVAAKKTQQKAPPARPAPVKKQEPKPIPPMDPLTGDDPSAEEVKLPPPPLP